MQYFLGDMLAEISSEEMLLFDLLLHIGTLTAVFVAFWDDIKGIILAFFGLFSGEKRKDPERLPDVRMLLLLVVTTAPLILVVFFKDAVEKMMENMYFVGGALIFTGALLLVADKVKPGRKNTLSARISDAFFIGLAQVLATLPGISRSGATISTGIIRGYDRAFAVRFSFLMSIPAILAATVLQVVEVASTDIDFGLIVSFLPGVLTAALAGYASIILVRMLVSKGKFGGFAYYCAILGAVVLTATIISHQVS